MTEFECGATKKSEEDFAYYLYGIPASEMATLIQTVCQPSNRKHYSVGKKVSTTKFVADLLGTVITILRFDNSAFEEYERMEARRYMAAGVPYAPHPRNPILDYTITTDEWDVKIKVHHGMIDATYEVEAVRGVGVIDGRKCMLHSPWLDGDVETYLSQMSILRLMLPMLMEDAA